MPISRVKIGNKTEIEARKEEISELKTYLNNISDKSLSELRTWYEQRFSGFTPAQQDGIWMIVKTEWASAKVLKKLWKIVENIKTN
jgi:hypothetical protein